MVVKNLQNESRKYTKQLGCFNILEYTKDLSVSPFNAATEFFMEKMGVRRRQVIAKIKDSKIMMQAGALQWMTGKITMSSDVKGAKDLLGKVVKGAVTKESGVKPVYTGSGIIALEPTYKYLILVDVGSWGETGITIEDGMYLASDGNIELKVVSRKNMSSAVLGNEGLFNLSLSGNGIAVLESNVPEEELIEVTLENGELKIDGRQAVCWSTSLDFTVEKSTKSLIGSALSNEGLLNVYRGTGKVLMSPVAPTNSLINATGSVAANAADKKSNVSNVAGIAGSFLGGMLN